MYRLLLIGAFLLMAVRPAEAIVSVKKGGAAAAPAPKAEPAEKPKPKKAKAPKAKVEVAEPDDPPALKAPKPKPEPADAPAAPEPPKPVELTPPDADAPNELTLPFENIVQPRLIRWTGPGTLTITAKAAQKPKKPGRLQLERNGKIAQLLKPTEKGKSSTLTIDAGPQVYKLSFVAKPAQSGEVTLSYVPKSAPAATPQPQPQPEPVAVVTPRANEAVLEQGSYLSRIANSVYGDEMMWPAIYEANKQVIGADPHKVQAGLRLVIPSQEDAKEIVAWVQRGRSETMPLALRRAAEVRAAQNSDGSEPTAVLNQSGSAVSGALGKRFDDAVKAQVDLVLSSLVQSGAIEPAQVRVEVNGEQSQVELASADMRIDTLPIAGPAKGQPLVTNAELLPGAHHLEIVVIVNRNGNAFNYAKGQRLTLKAEHTFLAKAGKAQRLIVRVVEKGGVFTDLKDRLSLRVEAQQDDAKSVARAP